MDAEILGHTLGEKVAHLLGVYVASIVTEGPGLIETVLLFDTEAVELLLGLPEAEKLTQPLGLPEESPVLLCETEAEKLTQPLGLPEEAADLLIETEVLGVPEEFAELLFETDALGLLPGVIEKAAELVVEPDALELLLIKLLGLPEERGEEEILPALLGLPAAERDAATLTLPEDTSDELRDCVLLDETVTVGHILQTEVVVPQLALTLGLDDSDANPE